MISVVISLQLLILPFPETAGSPSSARELTKSESCAGPLKIQYKRKLKQPVRMSQKELWEL